MQTITFAKATMKHDPSLAEGDGEWAGYEERGGGGGSSVILRDRMITEASLPIRSEHSYCNDVPELRLPHIKLEDDMESECYPAISMSTATSGGGGGGGGGGADVDDLVTRLDSSSSSSSRTLSSASSDDSGIVLRPCDTVSQPSAVSVAPITVSMGVSGVSGVSNVTQLGGVATVTAAGQRQAVAVQPTAPRRLVLTPQTREELQLLRADRTTQQAHIKISAGQSVLRPQTIVLTSRPSLVQRPADSGAVPRLSVKLEPNTAFVLPPTPPSSVDSDGGSSPPYAGSSRVSPVRSLLQRPPKVLVTAGRPSVRHVSASLISTTPRGAHGTLYLTEEEKRTLISEGYSVPNRLPLSKAEERSLKKIRRKIKNKISAQESRRKKKEYMDQMERRLDQMAADNDEYRRQLEQLEAQRHRLSTSNAQLEQRNAQLATQLEQLRKLIGADCPQIKDEKQEVENPK
ncbi:cyclic AMP-dependent transcription factor ATF-6 beta-like isoform X2 [Amphibalanus amphitrite]|uniref:cyclic AMP-dependent transcription factor ATF-6 beta-like isoform X2 n=1 Tax=Amphibalanus amphitrite TaxID=1232801 RepID=UPI001C929B54|nr:cyclic AMP-dependent transcription factor ATF-6 beta-like isoform X2 [Amphibalanus amphitrite]